MLIKHGICWHKLQIFRRECQYIIDNLMAFFNNQILNVSWNRFKQDLNDICRKNKNILQIKELHSKYIDHLMESCFLKPRQSDLRKRLHKMFELMLDFRNNTQKLLNLLDLDLDLECAENDNYHYIHVKNVD